MLRTAPGRSADKDNFLKLSSAYQACMNEPAIEKLGIRPLAELVEQIKQLSPLNVGDAYCSSNALSDSILFLARHGVSAFATFSAGADDANPDVVVVSVSPPRQVGLPYKEQYSNSTLLKKYQAVVSEVLSQLSAEQEDISALVVDLEQKIAAAVPTQEELQNITVLQQPKRPAPNPMQTLTLACPGVLQLDVTPRRFCINA
jgi:endothelin-converting enzyme